MEISSDESEGQFESPFIIVGRRLNGLALAHSITNPAVAAIEGLETLVGQSKTKRSAVLSTPEAARPREHTT